MTYAEAHALLTRHQVWRQYRGPIEDSPKQESGIAVGIALDVLLQPIWHDASEEPKRGDLLVEVELPESKYCTCAAYSPRAKTFKYDDCDLALKKDAPQRKVLRWAYLKDITQLI